MDPRAAQSPAGADPAAPGQRVRTTLLPGPPYSGSRLSSDFVQCWLGSARRSRSVQNMGSCPKPGCNYTSNRANNLSRHMRTHNGAPSALRTTARGAH